MPVTEVIRNTDDRALTIRARFAAPLERVWQLYSDPRQIEQVWGPPGFPATFVEHSLTPGFRCTYYMTGPAGEKYAGWWLITAVDEPHSFAFDDGFADGEFKPKEDLPVSHNIYRFEADGDSTLASFSSAYDTAEDLQTVLDMGMEEGATAAINQVDAFLAAN